MTRAVRTGALAAVAIVFTLALSGCVVTTPVATPSAPPGTVGPAESTPTAEPTDPLSTVTAFVARPEALELVDASGTSVVSLDYMGSVDDAIATLSAVLGSTPVEEPYEGGNHHPPGILHTWDHIVIIDERLYPEERRTGLPNGLVWPRFVVSFHADAVRGVELTTSSRIHVGDRFDDLGDTIDPDLWTCSGWAVEFIEVPREEESGPLKIGVGVTEWERETGAQVDHVVSVIAPVDVAEGCA